MTLRTNKGTSLSNLYYGEKKRLAWLAKLNNNCRKLLDPLGRNLTIDPISFGLEAARKSVVTLQYSGCSDSLARIERILDTRFEKGQAEVKFSRVTLTVKLKISRNLYNLHPN